MALITHQHTSFGDLVRIYAQRLEPQDALFEHVMTEAPAFSAFTVVPSRLQAFPTFRCAGLPDPIANEETLWLWDGVRELRVEQEPYLLRLPTRTIWSPGALVEALQTGWTDEQSGAGFFDPFAPRMQRD